MNTFQMVCSTWPSASWSYRVHLRTLNLNLFPSSSHLLYQQCLGMPGAAPDGSLLNRLEPVLAPSVCACCMLAIQLCVCVCEREREREREAQDREQQHIASMRAINCMHPNRNTQEPEKEEGRKIERSRSSSSSSSSSCH